ncbi:MAG TPA: hypothetical protein VIV12_12440 [Streptosporangiaceae bacterium]
MSVQPTRAICAYCRHPVYVRTDGLFARHTIQLPVSAHAVRTVGAGSVIRRCSGSGRPPKNGGQQ